MRSLAISEWVLWTNQGSLMGPPGTATMSLRRRGFAARVVADSWSLAVGSWLLVVGWRGFVAGASPAARAWLSGASAVGGGIAPMEASPSGPGGAASGPSPG